MKKEIKLVYNIFDGEEDLNEQDRKLIIASRKATRKAYAPYSNFSVGAVALMVNGKVIEGANQENASYPAGICAERTLLSVAGMLYPNVAIDTLAISYHNKNEGAESDHPISPCGICRQSLKEFENRVGQPVRLLLSGLEGKIFEIKNASSLLPLSFTAEDMK